jgi:hypothetical protein
MPYQQRRANQPSSDAEGGGRALKNNQDRDGNNDCGGHSEWRHFGPYAIELRPLVELSNLIFRVDRRVGLIVGLADQVVGRCPLKPAVLEPSLVFELDHEMCFGGKISDPFPVILQGGALCLDMLRDCKPEQRHKDVSDFHERRLLAARQEDLSVCGTFWSVTVGWLVLRCVIGQCFQFSVLSS